MGEAWILNETEPGGGGEPAPEPAPEPQPAPAPGPQEPEGPPEGYVPAEDYQALQEFVQTLPPEVLAPGYGQPPPDPYGYGQAEDVPPDPSIDPMGFKAWLDNDRQQFQAELTGRYDPMLEEMHQRNAQTQLDQAITGLPEDSRYLGLPDEQHERAEEAIEHLAAAFLPVDLAEQVANLPPQYAERVVQQQLGAAAQQASAYLGELLELARVQGRETFKASLQGGGEGQQPLEPSVAGAGIEGTPPAGSYGEIVQRYLGG
jgi:hypothetical protein